jgi:Sec-independent protein secretion pathway component TatC
MLSTITDRRNQQAGAVMGLGDHLEDLRRRVGFALLGLVPIVVLALTFSGPLLDIIVHPLQQQLLKLGHGDALIVTAPLEQFTTYFNIAVIASLVVGAPWIVYQLWRFVAPGLYAHERRFAHVLAPLSIGLSIAGVLLFYYAFLPVSMYMLFGWIDRRDAEPPPAALPAGVALLRAPVLETDPIDTQPGDIWYHGPKRQLRLAVTAGDATTRPEVVVSRFHKPGMIEVQPKLDEYVSIFMTMMLVFAAAFQLPVVILLLGWVGIVTRQWLAKFRKYAFAGSVVLCAVISPTGDPISLAILQIPVYLLYELGIILLWLLPASAIMGSGSRTPEGEPDSEAPPHSWTDGEGGEDAPPAPRSTAAPPESPWSDQRP